MIKTLEVKADAMIQAHLDRDPRVIAYRDSPRWGAEILEVEYDSTVPCPSELRHSADALGIVLS